MRKFLPQFLFGTIALALVGFFFAPHVAHAFNPLSPLDWISMLGNGVYGLLAHLFEALAEVAAWGVAIVGQGVDFALDLTLNKSFFDSEAINTTWSIIRDLCNMLFIFVLIWLGLRTILNLSNINVKKTITNVVIAALFINFSLFMTKAIIDVSNIGTAWFVQGIQNLGGGKGVSDSVRGVLQMEKLTIQSKTGDNAGLQSFVAQFARLVIYCVAIYVLFKVAFLLVARIVTFVFLLVTSPIAFMGQLELEDLGKSSSKWWAELRSQALMGPMFFLMLYITLYIVDAINRLSVGTITGTGVPDPVSGSAFGATNYVMFAIIIFMLLKCLEVAEEYSGAMGKQIAGYLQSAATFATGSIAMGTVGKAASAVAGNKSFQRWSANSGIIGEGAMRAVAGTAGASFGVSSSFKDLKLDKLGVPGTKNAFKGADKGYAGKVKNEVADYETFAKDNLGKGIEGAKNRQIFAKGLKGGLVGRIAASQAGLEEINESIANMSMKTWAKGAWSAAKSTVENRGEASAAKKIEDSADKELTKEEGIAAKKAKEEITKTEENEINSLKRKIEAEVKDIPDDVKKMRVDLTDKLVKLEVESGLWNKISRGNFDPESKEKIIDRKSGMVYNLGDKDDFVKAKASSAGNIDLLESELEDKNRLMRLSEGTSINQSRERIKELEKIKAAKIRVNKGLIDNLEQKIETADAINKKEKADKVDELLKKSENPTKEEKPETPPPAAPKATT